MQPDLSVDDVLNDDLKELSNVFNTYEDDYNSDSHPMPSLYYTESEINELFNKEHLSDNTHLKIFNLNIANILTKLNSLKLMVENIADNSNKPNIITITETHLNESRSQGYSKTELRDLLPGYRFFFRSRKERRGGGVGVFLAEELIGTAEIITENFFEEEVFESILVRIPCFPFKTNKKDLLVLTVYRQPGQENLSKFFEILQQWLDNHDKRHNEIIITGDFNLDLLKYQMHEQTSQYLDIMVSHGLSPVITKPTRIQHRSATLIDHIFTKISDVLSGIIVTELAGSHGYTDHYPIFIFIEKKKAEKRFKKVTQEYFTREGHKKRRDGLRNENWNDLYIEQDPNQLYNEFQTLFISLSKCIDNKN